MEHKSVAFSLTLGILQLNSGGLPHDIHCFLPIPKLLAAGIPRQVGTASTISMLWLGKVWAHILLSGHKGIFALQNMPDIKTLQAPTFTAFALGYHLGVSEFGISACQPAGRKTKGKAESQVTNLGFIQPKSWGLHAKKCLYSSQLPPSWNFFFPEYM